MANRSFLICTTSPTKPFDDGKSIDVLCAASYMIPVFWYMLFDHSNVIEATADYVEGGQAVYPYLTESREPAIERCRSRWPAVRGVIGGEYEDLFELWLRFLDERSHDFIQIEAVELYEMWDEGFRKLIADCIAAFDNEPWREVGFIRKHKQLVHEWSELLGQANISDGKTIAPAGTFSFCGYSWREPVPWESSEATEPA